jgi:hypothetical protein
MVRKTIAHIIVISKISVNGVSVVMQRNMLDRDDPLWICESDISPTEIFMSEDQTALAVP